MGDEHLEIAGEPVDAADLRIPKAAELARAVETGSVLWASLVECRRVDGRDGMPGSEGIVIDLDVEVPQDVVHDVRRRERVLVEFQPEDTRFPEVLSLRPDFPRVPHLNLRLQELPRSLCLFDRPYDEVKLHWTAPGFVERIRSWLAATATGTLHGADQPLEPLLLGTGVVLVLPSDMFASEETGERDERISISLVRAPGRHTLFAERVPAVAGAPHVESVPCVATAITVPPQAHGVIHAQPTTLSDLAAFLSPFGVDLIAILRERLVRWVEDPGQFGSSLILIVTLPKTRETGATVEATDVYAFACISASERSLPEEAASFDLRGEAPGRMTILEIGARLGLWEISNGLAARLIPADTSRDGSDVGLFLMNVTPSLSREGAARLNGLDTADGRHVVAVGAGALGSQVYSNLVRSGFGEWVLIDKDVVLPHNMARHALLGAVPGWPKAEVLAELGSTTIDGEPSPRGIAADVLDPGDRSSDIAEAFAGADVILDMSASVAVARHLSADLEEHAARRVSLFLSPSGRDSILLAEDRQRRTPLASLEMQFYRMLARHEALSDHYQRDGEPVRYAHSCRDLSARLPQEWVALHAAIGARALRVALASDEAAVALWRAEADGSVTRHGLTPACARVRTVNHWTIVWDEEVERAVRRAREEKLPHETGGVLIGMFDMLRETIYVADMLPGPPDSREDPDGYERGADGLLERVGQMTAATGGNLVYVGEWHSHPPNHGAGMSEDDRKLFTWLRDRRSADGLPAVMLIVGEREDAWYVRSPLDPEGEPECG